MQNEATEIQMANGRAGFCWVWGIVRIGVSKERQESNSMGGKPREPGMEARLKTVEGGMGVGKKACRIGALGPVHHARPARSYFLQEHVQISDTLAASPT